MEFTLVQAIDLACKMHHTQLDKGGKPYILHPLSVMEHLRLKGYEDDYLIVGVLHDVIEDTPVTIQQLKGMGITKVQEDALIAITHNPNEPYKGYIDRVVKNRIACAVKCEDLINNLEKQRMDRIQDKATKLRIENKFHNAIRVVYVKTLEWEKDRVFKPRRKDVNIERDRST